MSEYQFYEFQAFDRLLSDGEMAELRAFSSRARITRKSFRNVYHYSDFKGDPNDFMDRYFDAFVYFANFGTRWFMLRVHEKLLDVEATLAYWVEDVFSCRPVGDKVVVSFCVEDTADDEWLEGDGLLTALADIRPALARGDHRSLYLGWLLGVQIGIVEDEELEPDVPPGLGELDPPLCRLAEFLGIDSDLISAAAERSADREDTVVGAEEIRAWVNTLARPERDELLVRLVAGEEPHLSIALQLRVVEGRADPRRAEPQARRTVADILARRQVLDARRKKREAARRARQKVRRERARAAARKKHLQSLVGQDESLWAEVERLIAARTQKSYEQAVGQLIDLRDLADMRGDRAAFARRLNRLCDEHRRKRTLLDRIDQAELLAA